MKKKTANIFLHTHWDNEWYFAEEDSLVQFSFGIKEMFKAFENGSIKHFFIDGQTAILDDYLKTHTEDKKLIKQLIKDKKIFVGPFHTQIDCFLTSGEAVINNLRLGLKKARSWGGVSLVAYLPDSFGHSQDFPKIFKGLGINDFVFRRGMGDQHQLPIDFYWQSNNGDSILVNILQSGYGFAGRPFAWGTLATNPGLDGDGYDIMQQMRNLGTSSALPNDFLLPIGRDQAPIIWDFYDLIKKYNKESTEFNFIESTLETYMQKLRTEAKNLPVYRGEFLSPQYHRVHKSLYSARADIKALQDRVERLMTYELQPLMTMLNSLGLAYDQGLIDYVWDLLARSQTHSSATNTDPTNQFIFNRTKRAFNLANACKVYLVRKIAISLPIINEGKALETMPLVVFNTLPYCMDLVSKLTIYTRKKDFNLTLDNQFLAYTILSQEKIYGGVIRKDSSLHQENLYFYKTTVVTTIKNMLGFSYQTIYVADGQISKQLITTNIVKNKIENSIYQVNFSNGAINITHKANNITLEDAIEIEDSGDEGDNYDYSYPSEDLFINQNLKNAKVVSCKFSPFYSEIELHGSLKIPQNLASRAKHLLDSKLSYKLKIALKENDETIYISGSINNNALNHRLRIVIKSGIASTHSFDGTQFGYIKRETLSADKSNWKAKGYLEEPDQINPLINHVSLIDESKTQPKVVSVFTRGIKEYEIIGSKKEHIALTIFRAVGHLGLPDLNRRPGRASGLVDKIIESPDSQMQGDNQFEFGLSIFKTYNANHIAKNYIFYAKEATYYQNQVFNRVVFPISYFKTNPLLEPIPHKYSLFSLQNSQAIFSTLKLSDNKKGPLVRLYNNDNQTCSAGIITSDNYEAVSLLTISEKKLAKTSNNLKDFKSGDIINILLQKK